MAELIEQLDKLGKEIKAAEEENSKEGGKVTAYLDTLKNECDLNSEEEAKKEVETLTTELEDIDKQINEKFSNLEANYRW